MILLRAEEPTSALCFAPKQKGPDEIARRGHSRSAGRVHPPSLPIIGVADYRIRLGQQQMLNWTERIGWRPRKLRQKRLLLDGEIVVVCAGSIVEKQKP
jgi:hypothetical protein